MSGNFKSVLVGLSWSWAVRDRPDLYTWYIKIESLLLKTFWLSWIRSSKVREGRSVFAQQWRHCDVSAPRSRRSSPPPCSCCTRKLISSQLRPPASTSASSSSSSTSRWATSSQQRGAATIGRNKNLRTRILCRPCVWSTCRRPYHGSLFPRI